ncbi:MAG: hypothetical protein ACT6RD_08180 [Brevundimonas sp.]|uniref:hypothetical protein n=1 Tax=Brevundimonas sp. TaxID=1871086 RepID=UPI004034E118
MTIFETAIRMTIHLHVYTSPGSNARGFPPSGFEDGKMIGKEEKRQRRRRDLERMRQKARRVRPHDPTAKYAEHLAVCSCWMCGNPRRFAKTDRLTLQERRAAPENNEPSG